MLGSLFSKDKVNTIKGTKYASVENVTKNADKPSSPVLLLFLIGSKFPSFHVFSAVDPRPFPRETKAGKRARNQRAKQLLMSRRFVATSMEIRTRFRAERCTLFPCRSTFELVQISGTVIGFNCFRIILQDF